jgi:hypothetical protein
MNKQEFEKLEKLLLESGYRKHNQKWHHEDYIIGKSFHKDDNQWEEGRAAYQIIISVYDWTLHPEYFDRVPESYRNRVSLEVHIDMSRVIDERLDLTFDWKESDTIEEIEKLAKEYYNVMCKIVPEPRKD